MRSSRRALQSDTGDDRTAAAALLQSVAMAHAWASAMHTRFTRSGVAYAVRSTAKAQPTSPTVLFAHGTGLAKEIWHAVQRRLEDADYHGVGCDQPWQGESRRGFAPSPPRSGSARRGVPRKRFEKF